MPAQSFLSNSRGGRGLDVEASHRVASPDQLVRGGIADRVPGRIVDDSTRVPFDRGQGITDHGERSIAEQIDLDQSGLFGLILLPLDHRQAGGGDFHRHIATNLIRDQHHAARVQTQIPEVSLELDGPARESPATGF